MMVEALRRLEAQPTVNPTHAGARMYVSGNEYPRPKAPRAPQAESRDRAEIPRADDHGAVVDDLARRVARLWPCHRDPARFHEEKSDIVYELERLASEVRRGTGPSSAQRCGVKVTREVPRLKGRQ